MDEPRLPSGPRPAQRPLRVGAVVFEGFELLDLFGPLEFFGLLGDWADLFCLGESPGSIRSSAGPRVCCDLTMDGAGAFDVLLIPGGAGTRNLVRDAGFLRRLAGLCERSETVAAVCTGSALLARAGLLDGRRATSNKAAFDWARSQGPRVNWAAEARWVEDGKYFTSSGIAAGMDMALALIERGFGPGVASDVCRRAEYIRNADPDTDPFAALAVGPRGAVADPAIDGRGLDTGP